MSKRREKSSRDPTRRGVSSDTHDKGRAARPDDYSRKSTSHSSPHGHSSSTQPQPRGSGSRSSNHGGGDDNSSELSASTSGNDPRDDNGRRRSGRNPRPSGNTRGQGLNSLFVLIYPNGSGHLCGTNCMTALASHWALYRGPRGGPGTRTDIILDLTGQGNESTNIMSHRGRPEVSHRPGYALDLSVHHPTPYYVADSVSAQALSAACRQALEGFQYNAITNNCQTFVLKVLEILCNRHITQQEYWSVYRQIASSFAPAHY